MKYKFHYRTTAYRHPSTVITRNEIVVWATPAFEWAINKTIGEVILWATFRHIEWECVGVECRAPE